MQRYGRFNRPGLRGSANYALLGGTEGAAPSPPPGPPSPSWTLDFSTGEPWANGTNYTFSSTASTTRTFVNSSGYVAPCVANLVQSSGEFENAYWNDTSNATCAGVASPTAPDNSTDAAQLTETTANSIHARGRNSVTTSTGAITLSAYVKKGSRQYVGLYHLTVGGNSYRAIFDLDNNAAFSAGNPSGTPNASYGSESVGNGWFRIWITLTAGNATGYPGVFLSDRAGFTGTLANGIPSYTGSTSESMYVWGLQCVEGSAPLPYSATTTSSNGIPRLTHNSSGSRLGLLVEESRTNSLQRSEDFANAYWTKRSTTIDNNGGSFWTAPDNASTAVLLEQVSGTDAHNITSATFASQTNLCFSVFAKKQTTSGVGRFVSLLVRLGSSEFEGVVFDLDQGTVTQTSQSGGLMSSVGNGIENYGNGWYRCHIRGTRTSSGNVTATIALTNTGTPTLSATGQTYNAANSTDGVYIWGAQYETVNQTPSSYIPTTTASVTRSADLVHVLDSSITSWGDPGALVVHFYPPGQAGTLISTDDASTAQVGIEASTTTAARAFWSSGSTATGTIGSGVQKAVHYWNGSTSKFCINGGTVQSGTNNFTIANADFVTLGAEATDSAGVPGTFSQYSNVIIRKVEFYSGTLTDANLQTITT